MVYDPSWGRMHAASLFAIYILSTWDNLPMKINSLEA